jgi:hypothetical protein
MPRRKAQIAAVPAVIDLTEVAPADGVQRLVHSVRQTCELVGCSRTTHYTVFAKGELVPRRILGRTVVTDADLRMLLRACRSRRCVSGLPMSGRTRNVKGTRRAVAADASQSRVLVVHYSWCREVFQVW